MNKPKPTHKTSPKLEPQRVAQESTRATLIAARNLQAAITQSALSRMRFLSA